MKRFLFLLIIGILLSCSKTIEDPLPYAPVYFNIDLRTWDSDLIGATNYKIFTQARLDKETTGYSGIFVVCGFDGQQHYAYDLCCPHEAQRSIKVEPTDAGTAICPQCKTIYETGNGFGNPLEGVSQYRLRKLNISYKNEKEFVVFY
ncbi:hypothetical protein D0T51_04360 [Parabacteroides sp. 52]|uniref:hypothetical protein n=1 Tax=unclassified Parabacteroides TaxID=2649774 RepID=UPI0013CFEE14|nr:MULTISPECIES: hypothetical protein [unclassified Parabacteroides]MDH6534135.1 nitrite reductase/ring-hydroxylating ferredoxin subunit [Parabacteroides sp. PM5-20]NDV54962.1 hypothetical protein [Parabacteroides sp. 52]